jgi:hypothetical protein
MEAVAEMEIASPRDSRQQTSKSNITRPKTVNWAGFLFHQLIAQRPIKFRELKRF